MGIVSLILGILYLVKRGKIAPLTAAAFPGASVAAFDEWKRCELRSIDIFLISTWGLGAFFLILGLVLGSAMSGSSITEIEQTGNLLMIVQVILLLIGLCISGVYGQNALKLRRALGSVSPSGASIVFSATSESNTWARIGRVLGIFALIPGLGIWLAPGALITGWLGLRAYDQDPDVGMRSAAKFALVSGAASLAVHGVVFIVLIATLSTGGPPH